MIILERSSVLLNTCKDHRDVEGVSQEPGVNPSSALRTCVTLGELVSLPVCTFLVLSRCCLILLYLECLESELFRFLELYLAVFVRTADRPSLYWDIRAAESNVTLKMFSLENISGLRIIRAPYVTNPIRPGEAPCEC